MVLGTRVSSYLKEYLMSKKEIEIKGKFRKEDFFSFIFSIFIFYSCLKNTKDIRSFCNSVFSQKMYFFMYICLSKASEFSNVSSIY